MQAAVKHLDKKIGGLAMSNAAFLFKKIIDLGKDIALNESQPFSEE